MFVSSGPLWVELNANPVSYLSLAIYPAKSRIHTHLSLDVYRLSPEYTHNKYASFGLTRSGRLIGRVVDHLVNLFMLKVLGKCNLGRWSF